ncbi:MAG: efflux RND transporter periplasmic adaptor subunit [Mesorhizobium sp.]|nr:MAG: efflux RND transporter periplasmic adaptor subunit [Mesorhizobium sp.]RWQ54048.1 MAG: efflux RND transporter periplasmic adaptor subunit [Mesorhizobium sp.]
MQQFFATMKPPAATVSTMIVKPTEWTPGVEAIGTVSAVRGVDLTVETAGLVKDILFHANQKVEANAGLLQLDDAAERADLDATKAQAALDQTALTRALELQKRDVGSESTLDSARAAALASASRVNRLQAVLEQKLLTAPFSGTIGIPRIDLGQYLSPGTSVATLQDLETMRADFSVPEQQLPLLKIGQTLRLGIGNGELPFAGTIRGIDPKINPTSRMVTVRAEVANPEGKLTPGQFVQVRVELPEENNVLTVPQTALTSSLYGDFVYVVRPAKPAAANGAAPAAAEPEEKPATDPAAEASAAKPEEKPAAAPAEPTAEEQKPQLVLAQVFVKPGRRNAGLVEILDGIAPGDEVVTAGQNRLSNGMSVAVDNTIDPTKPANQQAAQK